MRWIACALALALAACGSNEPGDLVVTVKTDLLPGFDFTEVRAEILDVAITNEPLQMVRASTAEHPLYLSGRDLAVFRGVAADRATVRVTVLAGEAVLVERSVVAPIAHGGASAVTVLATRDCRGVSCPGAGDPTAASECLSGACVEATCTPETPLTCPAARCGRDSDCPDSPVVCGLARCIDGSCLFAADESLCGRGQRCDLDLGCLGSVPDSGTGADAGISPDAGP